MRLELLLHPGRQGLRVDAQHGDEIVRRFPVALLMDVVIEEFLRILLGLALHDVGVGPDLDAAAVFARERAILVHLRPDPLGIVRLHRDEGDIAILGREMAALVGAARVHHHRVRLLDRLRSQPAFLDLVEASVEIELLLPRPQLLDDLEPFDRALVALVVLHLRLAEHLDLGLVPAGDDVEAEAAVGEMIDGGRLLRRHHRMHGRDMRGREDAGPRGRGADAGCPGERLEALSVEIGDAAEALPAPDRHQRLEAHLVTHFRERERARPFRFEHAVDLGDGAAARKIAGERAELELAIVEQRILALAQLIGAGIHGFPPCRCDRNGGPFLLRTPLIATCAGDVPRLYCRR